MKNNRKNRNAVKISIKNQLRNAVKNGLLISYKVREVIIIPNRMPVAHISVTPVGYSKYIELKAIPREYVPDVDGYELCDAIRMEQINLEVAELQQLNED